MMQKSTTENKAQYFVFLGILLLGRYSFAHQGHAHPSQGDLRSKEVGTEKIIQSYRVRVEPIFQNKCLQCHGGTPSYPWYYKLPVIKQYIDKDIQESKRHLNLSTGYPFVSHATSVEDLQAIKESDLPGLTRSRCCDNIWIKKGPETWQEKDTHQKKSFSS